MSRPDLDLRCIFRVGAVILVPTCISQTITYLLTLLTNGYYSKLRYVKTVKNTINRYVQRIQTQKSYLNVAYLLKPIKINYNSLHDNKFH